MAQVARRFGARGPLHAGGSLPCAMSNWLLAVSSGNDARVRNALKTFGECSTYQVPNRLKFGSFDSLVKNLDDLSKCDSQVEQVLRRLERLLIEMDHTWTPEVVFGTPQGEWFKSAPSTYLKNFRWEETLSPVKSTNVSVLGAKLAQFQAAGDDEVKQQAGVVQDLKAQANSIAKKESGTLAQRDLVDVLTPDVVESGDFVFTQHFTTLVVILPRGGEKDFQTFCDTFEVTPSADESHEKQRIVKPVVPMSMKKFDKVHDKDGFTAWRVVILKGRTDDFAAAARQRKAVVREFEFSVKDFKALEIKRKELDRRQKEEEVRLFRLANAAYSDAFRAYGHLKAMRCFVECALRFGVSPDSGAPKFSAFLFTPTALAARKEQEIRKVLGEATQADFGQEHCTRAGAKKEAATDLVAAEDQDYFPYVCLPLSSSFA
mmetsp:Transcript_26647/g.64164  ORF Transcript_26647/g.64164 Transcript_26647/m.64164 type:complete len:432 (-) Transcript_26647:85-1380(-)